MAAIGDKPFPTSYDNPGAEPAQAPSGTLTAGNPPATTPPATAPKTAKADDVLGRVVQGAHETLDKLAETAAPHVQRLQDGVGARAQQMRATGDEWTESLRCTVRDNPLAAVATALALGVVIARLTR